MGIKQPVETSTYWLGDGLPEDALPSSEDLQLRIELQQEPSKNGDRAIPTIVGIVFPLQARQLLSPYAEKRLSMGLVYHYTSPEGALGILQNKTLWFTDCEFMNDPAELAYCCDLLESAWLDTCEKLGVAEDLGRLGIRFCPDPYSDINLSEHADPDGAYHGTSVRRYILSASRDKDCIGIWNGFVKSTSGFGYALGFDEDVLNRELGKMRSQGQWHKSFDVDVFDVVYEPQGQREEMHNDVNAAVVRALSGVSGDPMDKLTRVMELRSELLGIAEKRKSRFKVCPFAYEREVRAVIEASDEYVSSLESEPMQLKFRAGPSGVITPYLEWNFSSCAQELVREVRLSPYMEIEASNRGMERLLRSNC